MSSGADSLVPLSNPEVNMTNSFFCSFFFFFFVCVCVCVCIDIIFPVGDSDMEIVVQVCNVMVCATFNQSLYLPVCVPDNREELFQETFVLVRISPLFFPSPSLSHFFPYSFRSRKKFKKVN